MKRRGRSAVTNVQKIDVGHHLFGNSARTPPTFITLNGLRRHGWNQIPAGWLVESSRPLTSDQIADARNVAADSRPHGRRPARKALLREDDGNRDGRGHPAGAGHPRDDGRTDP